MQLKTERFVQRRLSISFPCIPYILGYCWPWPTKHSPVANLPKYHPVSCWVWDADKRAPNWDRQHETCIRGRPLATWDSLKYKWTIEICSFGQVHYLPNIFRKSIFNEVFVLVLVFSHVDGIFATSWLEEVNHDDLSGWFFWGLAG